MSQMIKSRSNYIDLTDKQQAIVDAVVDKPHATTFEKAEIAENKLDGDDESVSRSYVSVVEHQLEEIIDQQMEIKTNERYEGEETTEGDPVQSEMFDEILSDGDSDEMKIEIGLMRGDIERLVVGDVPDRLKKDIVSRLVDQSVSV